MRPIRALLATFASVVFVASCAELPTATFDMQLTVSSTPVAWTINRPLPAFTPVTASNGAGNYSYSSTLPAGLSISSSTGQVTGTPTAPFTGPITISVTDAELSQTKTATFTGLTINATPVSTPNQQFKAITTAQNGTALNFQLLPTPAGGTSPFVYTVVPSIQPIGLTLNASTGAITGSPPANAPIGTTTYALTVTDAAGATITESFSVTIQPGLSTTVLVANQTCNAQQQCSFRPVGVVSGTGTAPYTYRVGPAQLGGAELPTTLNINATSGQITGVPTEALSATSYRVTVRDAVGIESSQVFQLTVSDPFLISTIIPAKACTQNHPCLFTPVVASGGTKPITYTSTSLPIGLVLNTATGEISGSPTGTQADATVTVTARDAAAVPAQLSAPFTIRVNGPVTTVQGPTTKICTASAPCRTLPSTASGGTAPYTFSVTPALPTGLTFSAANGLINGSAAGASPSTTYTVKVVDANGAPGPDRAVIMTINPALVTTATQPPPTGWLCTVGAFCTFQPVTVSGGTGARLTIAPALPPGLTLNATTGVISGTPAQNGAIPLTTFTVTGTDAAEDLPNVTTSTTFQLVVNGPVAASRQDQSPLIITANVPFATRFGSGGARPVVGAGGSGTLTYMVVPGLPAGLSFNGADGRINGTVNSPSNTSHYVVVFDNAGGRDSLQFSLIVSAAISANVGTASRTCTAGAACSTYVPVSGAGGSLPLSYSVSPSLPGGLVYNAGTGAVSGTPTAASAQTTYTVTITDQGGGSATASFSLAVSAALTVTPIITEINCGTANGCTGGVGVPLLTVSGGTPTVGYSLVGTLPTGLTLAPSGQLSGSPPFGPYAFGSFTIRVTDGAGAIVNQAINISSLTTSVPTPTQTCPFNAPCSITPVVAAGGKPGLSFALTAGSTLPANLSLNATTGAITGTATTQQAATTTSITVTDAAARTSIGTFTLSTLAGPVVAIQAIPVIACGDFNGCTVGIPFKPVTATGGTGIFNTYLLSGGTLPSTFTFDGATGIINGSAPTLNSDAMSPTTFSIQVKDNGTPQQSGTANFTFSSLTSLFVQNVNGQVGTPIAGLGVVDAQGGSGPLTYTVSPALPAGLSHNNSHIISGTPTVAAAQADYVMTITDALGRVTKKTFKITIDP